MLLREIILNILNLSFQLSIKLLIILFNINIEKEGSLNIRSSREPFLKVRKLSKSNYYKY